MILLSVSSTSLPMCLLFTGIVTLQAIHSSSCFGSQISLCAREFGLHGFCPYDFYLFLQEESIKLFLDFNFPLLLVAFIIFKPLLALSKGPKQVVKNLARLLQMNCRADSQTMTDVHIGCDLPRQHSTSNVVGDDNCSGLITQLFSEPCPKEDMFCFIMLRTNFYQDRVSVGA